MGSLANTAWRFIKPLTRVRLRRMAKLRRIAIVTSMLVVGLLGMDHLFPPQLPGNQPRQGLTTVVLARDGSTLRAFADQRGIWRNPVKVSQVSPRFIEALIGYEDRWFYQHPGVNLLALLRAAGQAIWNRRIVSGGSTLTMQVARLLEPDLARRSIGNKLLQIARAFQLEWHLDKTAILQLYLNHAPYGGTIEGIETASRTYLGHSAQQLSHAEAALLAVLPQAPSRLRPDRHPQRAQTARDKVLRRLQQQGTWSAQETREAMAETVSVFPLQRPQHAPLLARRLHHNLPQATHIETTIDPDLQQRLEADLRNQAQQMPAQSSMAVLVVRNRDMAVQAWAGSADFSDERRFGQVDIIPAIRSPGSTLKPLLYGLALEDGLIHSQSLLVDAPLDFDGYRPHNFSGRHRGAVSASEALQASLNVPAVSLLQHLGPQRFISRLRHGGMHLQLPAHARANPSIILGGLGTSLQSLVSAYAALAREGLSAQLRVRPSEALTERRLLSPGAAWITANMLAERPLPGQADQHRIAWKTGTSYGYRDAWAIGVSREYTVGVWSGRPDGTPVTGQYGALTAVPVLARTFAELETHAANNWRQGQPASVHLISICWPTGLAAEHTPESQCHIRKQAWVLNDTIPPTLAATTRQSPPLRLSLRIDPASGHRLLPGCGGDRGQLLQIARWPVEVLPWLPPAIARRNQLPALDKACQGMIATSANTLHIQGRSRNLQLRPAPGEHQPPTLQLRSRGGNGKLRWLINNRQVSESAQLDYRFGNSGDFRVTVIDESGQYDSIRVQVSL